MSIAVEETQYTPITADDLADAPENILPRVAAVATVGEISDPKLTESGNYYRCTVKLKGSRGASDFTTGFMFLPQWFVPGWEYSSLQGGETFVYKMNIGMAAASRNGFLYTLAQSLADTPEAGWQIFKAALAAKMNSVQRYLLTAEEIVSVIRGLALRGTEIAYTLKQQEEKTDAINPETGKAVRRKLDRSEVDYYTAFTAEWVKSQVKRAGDPKNNLLIGFTIPQGIGA